MRKQFFIFCLGVFIAFVSPAMAIDSYSNALYLIKIGLKTDAALMLHRLSMDNSYILNDYANYRLAQLYQENGLLETAEAEYLKVAERFKDSIVSTNAYIKAAEIRFVKSDYKQAAFYYDAAVKNGISKSKLDYARYRAGLCYEKDGNVSDAIERYSQIVICNPFSKYLIKSEERLKFLGVCARMPTSHELFERAEIYFERKDYASAAENYKAVLDRYPGSSFAAKSLLKLGMCYYKSGFSSAAIKLFDSAKNIFPEALFYKGQALLQNGNPDALLHFSKIAEIFPDSELANELQLKIADYFSQKGYEDVAESLYSYIIKKSPKSQSALEAHWKLGFSNYVKNNYDKAYNIFGQACENSLLSSTKIAACIFWQAKCAEKMGMKDVANQLFDKVYAEYPNSYYGFRAAQILNKNLPSYNKKLFFNFSFDYSDSDNLHWKKFCELFKMKIFDAAFEEAEYFNSIAKNLSDKSKSAAAMASVLAVKQDFHKAIRFVERGFEEDLLSKNDIDPYQEQALTILYPRWYGHLVEKYSQKYNIEPSLLYAIIREESRFNRFAISRAMAHGLTQIMPATGRGIAKRLGMTNYRTSKLFEPETNIKMGAYYISQLLKKYKGNMHLALAAYNGGSGRVRKWTRQNGLDDIDEFVENIPFRETRGYVKKVLESYWQYKRIYDINGNAADGEKNIWQKKTTG